MTVSPMVGLSSIHPKTGGAAVGGTLGTLIMAILSTTGVHVAPELPAAVSAFLAALGAYLSPTPVSEH